MGLNLNTFGGGPLEGWSFTGCAIFAVWGSEITWLSSLTGAIYLGLESFDSFCKGLERSQLLGSILHGLERTCHFPHFVSQWSWKKPNLVLIFATFGRWSWKETFTCVFVRGLGRSLRLCILGCGLERFWWMVLKGLICFFASSVMVCHQYLVNGLEMSCWSWYFHCFLWLKWTWKTFLHNTWMRPNLTYTGCPMMISFRVLVSTMWK